jgi:hypothetical protein
MGARISFKVFDLNKRKMRYTHYLTTCLAKELYAKNQNEWLLRYKKLSAQWSS